jgi:DNA-binding response OmpR family regulator
MREEELLAEVASLKEQLADLTGRDLVAALQARLRLARQAASILAVITKRGARLILHESIYRAALEHPNGDGPTGDAIKVQICRIRKALKTAGAPGEIHTVHGRGYQADQSLCDWVRSIVNPEQEMAA